MLLAAKPLVFFSVTIYLGRFVVTSPKIFINLARTYEKPHCKGVPHPFSGWGDNLVHTQRKIEFFINIYMLYVYDILHLDK